MKEEFLEVLQTKHLGQNSKIKTKAYSCNITLLGALARRGTTLTPPLWFFQQALSIYSLGFEKRGHSFFFLQISYETNMEREVIGFLEWPLLWIPSIHHSFTLCMALPISWIHIMKSKLNLQGGLLRSLLEKRHWKRKWLGNSYTWLQILHIPQFYHPLHSGTVWMYAFGHGIGYWGIRGPNTSIWPVWLC
jgi:hypothetical protein